MRGICGKAAGVSRMELEARGDSLVVNKSLSPTHIKPEGNGMGASDAGTMEYVADPELQAMAAKDRERRIQEVVDQDVPREVATLLIDKLDHIAQRAFERSVMECGTQS